MFDTNDTINLFAPFQSISDIINLVSESSVDYPRIDLSVDVWDKDKKGNYFLKNEVKEIIIDILSGFEEFDILDSVDEIRIVGSICTNRYLNDGDIDVHIVIKDFLSDSDKTPLEWQDIFRQYFKVNQLFVGDHPIEIYLQLDSAQDLMSDGVYDFLNDKWIKGPLLVDFDYNPYEVFADVRDKVRKFAAKADIDIGELKRDVIDYDIIFSAMKELPNEYKIKLRNLLLAKLDEIEDNIKKLMKDKKVWTDMRKKASKPKTPEEALKDAELAKRWADTNAVFKFLDRYEYMKLIKSLEKIMDDGKIDYKEVDVMKSLLGINKGEINV